VISDNFLLTTTEKIGIEYINQGKHNLIGLFDAILPSSLNIPFHITIISEDKDRSEEWRNRLAEELRDEIGDLRDYEINVEVVFIKSEHLHERILLMNYINSSCEHGFCAFKAVDGKTVTMVNKLQINSYFSSINNTQGESEFEIASKDLQIIKDVCNELAAHIHGGDQIYRGSILGGCNPDKSLKNRLINDV
jgi:hypothetical protein